VPLDPAARVNPNCASPGRFGLQAATQLGRAAPSLEGGGAAPAGHPRGKAPRLGI